MEIIISIIGLILSFFFAGAEIAFISTQKIRLEIWARDKIHAALKAKEYFNYPENFLSVTLIGNNIANVIVSSYATLFLIQFWSEKFVWLFITFIVLLFGEIIPKIFFRSFANNIILKIIYPIRFFEILFKPIVFIVTAIISRIFGIVKLTKEDEKFILSKDDVSVFIREAHYAGIVDQDEHKIISRILALPSIQVKEAETPRTSIQAIEQNRNINSLRKLMIRTGYTKIPVYKKDIDNIIGVVFIYDLFKKVKEIKEIIKPIKYIPENKKCNELLHEFRNTNTSIAIVIDEYGGTSGLVTLEDLVEVLFGDFEELADENITKIIALNKITWRIYASELIENINDKIGISIPAGNYDTLAGYIITQLGYIPKIGEKIVFQNFYMIITKANKKKVIEVRLIRR
jgi:putative hemolysin